MAERLAGSPGVGRSGRLRSPHGFRGSADYERWKGLLHHFYDPFPVVEHFTTVPKRAS
jgi:hypothetical protein